MIRFGDNSETVHATAHEGTHVNFLYHLGEKPATVVYWLENDGKQLNGQGEIELTASGSVKVRVNEPKDKGDLRKPTMLRLVVRVDGARVGEDVIEFIAPTVKPLDLDGFAIKIHSLPGEVGTMTVAGKGSTVYVRAEALTTAVKFRFFTTFGMERGEMRAYVFKPGRDGWYQIPELAFPRCTTDSAKGMTYYFKFGADGQEQRLGEFDMILDHTNFSKRMDRDAAASEAYADAGIVNP